jgi:uncharacterized protein (DUF2336 family)
MSFSLSQADVVRLLAGNSAPARVAVAEKLAETIESAALSEDERRIAEDIARSLAQDIAVAVRYALAHGLRYSTRLPHDVALRLANDVEDVALPVIAESPVLSEADLVGIVRTGSPRKQVVVAGRPDVTEKLADALITAGAEPAVVALMDNAGARIAPASLDKALDRFGRSEAVKESMAKRAVLPLTVTERLVAMVSDRLQRHLIVHHDVPAEQLADIVLQVRDRVTLNLSSGCNDAELQELTAQMHHQGRLTSTLVWRALSLGDTAFFEAAMAALAEVPIENARLLIHDAGPKGLTSLYRKSGLPARLFPAIRVAVNVLREVRFDGGERDHERYRARVITRILTQLRDLPVEDLNYMLAKLGDVLTIAA